MVRKTYKEKLLDPRWQKKRLEVLSRDNFTCIKCGDAKNTLHVHHKSYKGNPWEINISELETLCALCHEKSHEKEFTYDHENHPVVFRIKKVSFNFQDLIGDDYSSIRENMNSDQYNRMNSILFWHCNQILKFDSMNEEEYLNNNDIYVNKVYSLKEWRKALYEILNEYCLTNNILVDKFPDQFGVENYNYYTFNNN